MKSLRKILTSLIVISILSITVLPVTADLFKKLNFNGNILWSILDIMSDFAIVKASDTDYGYVGNLYLRYNSGEYDDTYLGYEKGLYVYTCNAAVPMEYSVNYNSYKECEYLNYGSYILDLDNDINVITVKHVPTGNIVLESVVKKYKDGYINIEKTKVGWGSGSKIRIAGYEWEDAINLNLEYSMDNGETFKPIDGGFVLLPSLYEGVLIIREKDTQEVIYKSPVKEDVAPDLQEEYIYENGKTTLKFNLPENIDNRLAQYSYVINGEEKTGNEVTIEEDSDIKLKVTNTKEFMTYSFEKDITAKVVKVEKPEIEQIDDETINIISGEITNDTLGKIYYSIDDEEIAEYTDTIKLEPGTHIIKVYQTSKDTNIKSEEVEKEITVEKKDTEKQEDDTTYEEKEDTQEQENTEIKEQENSENINNEDIKVEDVNDNNKLKNINIPKTGDNILIFFTIIIAVITLNSIIKNNKNKKS